MKKVFVVSKTHLDLGYTDFANNVKQLYLNKYINNAVDVANKINANDKKFVWTTGSWILKEALVKMQGDDKLKLVQAIKKGYVVPHGMPYTTHTELLDKDLLEYGLNIIDDIDELAGRKTIACKMTDVPGHTIALVPYLVKKGFKLLHIGVNGASKLPDVPECFVWKNGKYEIIVIYNGQYGGAYESEFIDDILYFSHTLDNKGSGSCEDIINGFNEITEKYPDHEVVAGTMDEYCELLYKVKDKLPVITSEIGDSWIHGVASDPLKVGVYKLLCQLKTKWLESGELDKSSDEYKGFADNLMCIAEHTWGLDSKRFIKDYDYYLTDDFNANRSISHAGIVQDVGDDDVRLDYATMQKSWQEQRLYLGDAISSLSQKHQDEANAALKAYLNYDEPTEETKYNFESLSVGDYKINLNKKGGLSELKFKDCNLIQNNDNPTLVYKLYGSKDFETFQNTYMRDFEQVAYWATPGFLRPRIKNVDSYITQGNFEYSLADITFKKTEDKIKIIAKLEPKALPKKSINIKKIYLTYILDKDGLEIELMYPEKSAIRLTESLHFNLYPQVDSLIYEKIGEVVDPYDIVQNGNRNLSCVDKVSCKLETGELIIENKNSPLVSIGQAKITNFDNIYADIKKDGLSYTIFNNIWGTNFPLWIEGGFKTSFKVMFNSNL